jgi:hypothetical protein
MDRFGGPTTIARIIVLISLLIVSTIIASGEYEKIFDKYVDRPNLILATNPAYGDTIKDWLKSIHIQAGSSIPVVLERLQEAGNQEQNATRRDLDTFLIGLATLQPDNKCPEHLFNLFMAIYKQIDGPELSELVDYMEYYGREKFGKCIEYDIL